MAERDDILTSLKMRIERGQSLKRLLNVNEFKIFLDIVKHRQSQYRYILENPRDIGLLHKYNTQGGVQYFKISPEEDASILKEAQIRWDTFQKILDLINVFTRDGEIAEKELERITKSTSSEATDVKK